MRSRLRRPEEVVVLPQLLRGELGGGRLPASSAAPQAAAPRPTSRPYPCWLLEPWRKWWGRSMAWWCWWQRGAERCSLSALRRRRGAAEIFENGVTTSEVGKLPLFPLLIKREGANVSPFRIKKPPMISPTMPQSTRAVRGGRGGCGVGNGTTRPRVPVPCFGPGPTALGTVCGPGPGAPVGVLE